MPLPILLAASLLFQAKASSHRSFARNSSPHRLGRPSALRPAVAVKDDVQFVMITSPDRFSHRSLYRQMMPLKAVLKLDERTVEAREEQGLIAAINNERARQGMNALALDPLLTETARTHCLEMCRLDYFEHESPTAGLRTPMDRYLDSLHAWGEGQPHAALVGENIFFCSVTNGVFNAAYAHQSLMASPGHRANILDPRFSKVGVGLYRDSQGQFWVTEMFLWDSS